jgi:hypothetical protein
MIIENVIQVSRMAYKVPSKPSYSTVSLPNTIYEKSSAEDPLHILQV